MNLKSRKQKQPEGDKNMEMIKKLVLFIIALLCIVFVISPADLLPGIMIDDILYIIGAIIVFGKANQIKLAD